MKTIEKVDMACFITIKDKDIPFTILGLDLNQPVFELSEFNHTYPYELERLFKQNWYMFVDTKGYDSIIDDDTLNDSSLRIMILIDYYANAVGYIGFKHEDFDMLGVNIVPTPYWDVYPIKEYPIKFLCHMGELV